MEDSKYYTPEISEFFVGFEYDCILPQWEIQDWRSTVVGTNEDLDAIYQCIKLDRIRVKLLDKSDIESCGFNQIPSKEFAQDVEEYQSNWSIGPNPFRLSKYKNLITISHQPHMRSSRQLFEGIIKNISELRKLLKQLGIDRTSIW